MHTAKIIVKEFEVKNKIGRSKRSQIEEKRLADTPQSRTGQIIDCRFYMLPQLNSLQNAYGDDASLHGDKTDDSEDDV